MIFGLSLITISTAAAAATISIGNGSTEVGGTVVVPLMINDVTGAGSVEINLTYDPSVVIPVSITNSDFNDIPPQDLPINPQSGYVIINAMQFITGLNGSVKIGDITLQAVGSEGESSPLNLTDVTLQDMDMQDLPVGDALNGTFKINGAPDLDPIGSKSVDEGQTLSFTISAADPDGDALTFSASNLPAGATFNPANQTFSWTPTFEQAGVYENVHFEVTDGNLTDRENITITVNNVNRAPAVSGLVNQSGIVGAAWTYDMSYCISDPDGGLLTVTVDDDNISVSGFVLTFNYTVAVEDKPVLITVTDAGGLSSSQTVFVTAVAPDNIPPDITNNPPILDEIGRKKIKAGKTLSFTISADDPDGDALTFSASNLPEGASFYRDTQTFLWTPTFKQVGVYRNVHFEVSDGNLTDWENIMIQVKK